MAPRKSPEKSNKAMTSNDSAVSSGAGVVKRRYKNVRFHENGLLNVERKSGKYFKMAQQNQRQSPLLRLPAELRNQIFVYALGGKTFDIEYHFAKFKNTAKYEHPLALLQVCRQIYAETTLLPFSINTFSASTPYKLVRFAESLHPTRARSITWVRLDFDIFNLAYYWGEVFEILHFEEPLLSSELFKSGYAVLHFDDPGTCLRLVGRKGDISRKLQKTHRDLKFVWE